MNQQQPLNILMICKSLPWRFKGGIQTHVWELAQQLTASGNRVTVLTGGAYTKPEAAYSKEHVQIVEIPYFPGRYLGPISMLAEEYSFNRAVKRWVLEHHKDFQVIHTQGRSGCLLHGIRAIQPKLINTVHGLITKESNKASRFNLNVALHRSFAQSWEKKVLDSSKECLAVSQDLSKSLTSISTKPNFSVIQNGVKSVDHTSFDWSRKAGRFLFVGRLHTVKGILPLVNAMEKAPAHIRLDIIGDGPLREPLKALIAQKGLSERVRLLGEHENEAIQRVLPSYVALVLPSHYETQGIVLLEANAQAIPVIASDIPAIRETVRHGVNGILCNSSSSESFVEAMTDLAGNKEAARIMGLRGKQLMKANYSWESIAARTEQVYRKIAV